MRKLIAIAAALSITLTGCTFFRTVVAGQSVAQAAPQTIAQAEKGLVLAHLAYNGLGTALIAAANSGVLHGATAATAKADFDAAGNALKLADDADNAANVSGIVGQVSAAEDLIVQAKALIH